MQTEPVSEDPQKNPWAWLKPMPVMWLCVILSLGLIVLGTWLNKQAAAQDTKEVVDKFNRILDDFEFTPAQRQTLESEFEATLAQPSTRADRRAAAAHVTTRVMQSISCVAIAAMVGTIDSIMQVDTGDHALAVDIREHWPAARLQCARLIHAADRGMVESESVVATFTAFIQQRNTWTLQRLTRFEAECKQMADAVKAPDKPEPFDMYESLRRGIVEARDAKEE